MTEDELMQLARRQAPGFVEFIERSQEAGRIHTIESAAVDPDPMPFICFRVAAITGSVSKRCELCQACVWVAPSGQEMLRKRGDRPTLIICDQCAFSPGDQVEKRLAAMRPM